MIKWRSISDNTEESPRRAGYKNPFPSSSARLIYLGRKFLLSSEKCYTVIFCRLILCTAVKEACESITVFSHCCKKMTSLAACLSLDLLFNLASVLPPSNSYQFLPTINFPYLCLYFYHITAEQTALPRSAEPGIHSMHFLGVFSTEAFKMYYISWVKHWNLCIWQDTRKSYGASLKLFKTPVYRQPLQHKKIRAFGK